MGYGKVKKSVSSQEQEMQTCGLKIGKNYKNWSKRRIIVEVERVKSHRTKKEKEKMTKLEKADELAKAGAMLDEGFMAEARAETMNQEREEVYVALQYAASFHCLVEEWKDCEELKLKPKEKWISVG